jgi:putative ABC transport system permease protein
MPLWDTVALAFEALGRNLLRSALTALGIIIGVAAVIVMMALGDGARASIAARIQSLGTNLLIVMPGSMTANGVRSGQGGLTTLSSDDAAAIREQVTGVRAVSPGLNVRTQVVASTGNWQTQVQGASADLPDIRAWPVDTGAFFTANDVERVANVAVLGAVVRDQLFGAGIDPAGVTIRIDRQPFKVVGVLSRKGQSPIGQDQDDTVVVPYTTVQKRLLGVTYLSNISVAVEDEASMSDASAAIAQLLRTRHRLSGGDPDDFTIRSSEDMANVLTATTTTMTYLLASVAAVSLLVGGIGIMNIMLVSVTERTREVGLRRSLGARRRDVLRQFLAEALALGIGGGLSGVALGIGLAFVLSAAFSWTTVVSVRAVGLSFGFAALVGLFFGFYPARRAAALNPTEALRYE